MLGAASVTLTYAPAGAQPQRIAFSGDIGVPDQPLIVDVARLPAVDTVVMESTYGDRPRDDNEDRYNQLAEIVKKTFARGGNVIIPAFAVGRVQDLLYGLHRLIHAGTRPANIIVDSPLAASDRHFLQPRGKLRRGGPAVRSGGRRLPVPADLRITRSVENRRS